MFWKVMRNLTPRMYNSSMKNNPFLLQCKRILASLCILGEGLVLYNVIDDLIFELENLGSWGYDYLFTDLFLLLTGILTVAFMVSIIVDAGRQIRNENEMRYEEEQAHLRALYQERKTDTRKKTARTVKEEEEITPEELQELLQNDYGEQKKNARM